MSKEYNIGIYIRLSMADEDTGYGSCGTTSYKQHERLVVHTEESSKIGTDG